MFAVNVWDKYLKIRKRGLWIKTYLIFKPLRQTVSLTVLNLIVLGEFGLFQCASSQTFDRETKFRLAQGLEQAGEYDRATELYQELLRADPTNAIFFDALQRTLMQLKKYDEVIHLLRSRIAQNPSDLNLHILLGSVYYRAGRDTDATAEWDQTIAGDPRNPNTYRNLASVMMENRLLERSIGVYRKGREMIGDPNLFDLELAQLLTASMDYSGAATEYVRWLRSNPTQLAFVQNRLAQITGKEQARTAAINVIQETFKSHQELPLLQLLGWLQMEGKEFEKALETYRTIDGVASAHGNELYQFAERAFNEKAFDVAARAYREAIDAPVPATRMPYARFGYANAVKELSARVDTFASPVRETPVTEAVPLYRGPIALFQKIIDDYPHSEFSARAYYQIGLLQFGKFSDRDGAIDSFHHVLEEVNGVPALRYDADLMIGRIHLARGDTVQATGYFHNVVAATDVLADQHDEAVFHLAEIEYFGGQFDSSMNLLSTISANLKANFANDALRLEAFLSENVKSEPEALREFAHAEFLARQERNTEAISLLLDIVSKYPRASVADDALMSVASLQAAAGLFHEAIGSYMRLLAEFKETSVALDRAQFQLAEVYQYGVHDTERAISTYEELLAEHPKSILGSQARKHIRQLRGEIP